MRIVFSLLTCFFFLLSPALAQKHYDRFHTLDVQHYAFELQLNDQTDKIKGTATLTIKFKTDTEKFTLDLTSPNADGRGMTVLTLTESGQPIPFDHKNDRVTVKIPVGAGEVRQFLVTYEGIPATGLIISKNKYGDRTFFGDNWPDRGKNWLPIVDHPSDKATVEWIVTAPSHYQVVGNGQLIERTNLDHALTLTHWKSSVQLPTKVMVIGVARFAIRHAGTVDHTPVSSWIYPQDREKGFHDYELAVPIMEWFIDYVGDYPYTKLANVQSKTQFGGMENASNIFYSENSVTGRRSSEALIAHEIAHQWFGNSATEANWHHVWLSEGFATYFTNLYYEQKHGRDAFIQREKQQRRQIISFSKMKQVPVVNPAIEQYMELLNPNSYQKGGWVLHMLRRAVGDDHFRKGIRTYYERFKLSNALTEDLKNVFEEVSGKELDLFFEQWVFRAGQPDLEVSWKHEAGALTVTIGQVQDQLFRFPLDIGIVFDDGSTAIHTVAVDSATETWTVDVNKKPVNMILDPDTWLLFEGKVSAR